MDGRLADMSHVHLVIPDLFLPQQVADAVSAGLALPALETLLARASSSSLPQPSLEAWLCDTFGVAEQSIAPVCLCAEGVAAGAFYWLRADPVHLRLQRDQLVLQADQRLTVEEAAQLCDSLNTHFSADGLHFIAPQPQRWYLRLETAPNIRTQPLAQVAGKDIHPHLPQGKEALHWHGVFNEIQMLLFEHAVNQAREERGELPINSVWLWGGGHAVGELGRPYSKVFADSELVAAFAQAAGIPYDCMPVDAAQYVDSKANELLFVAEGLRRALQYRNLHDWREELQRLENNCLKPLLAALRDGRIARLRLDVPQAGVSRRYELTRAAAWKLWQRPKSLAGYSR